MRAVQFAAVVRDHPRPERARAAARGTARPAGRFTGRGGGADSSAFQAFTSCLKDHGVTLATASPGATNRAGGGFGGARGLNTSGPKTAKAYDTCKALLPQRPSGAPVTGPSA